MWFRKSKPKDREVLERQLNEARVESKESEELRRHARHVAAELDYHKRSNGFTELMINAIQGGK